MKHIDRTLVSIHGHSFLVVCMMSHGSAGKLHTSENGRSININDILYHLNRRVKEQLSSYTIPMVCVMIWKKTAILLAILLATK